jgi:Raf kinase inhibitor-like YbhB/YbcL family protein
MSTIRLRHALPIISAFAFATVAFAASAPSGSKLEVVSDAFKAGGTIPRTYTCDGADKSPPLAWQGVPTGTKTLALIVKDPDAPSGTFIHWVLYNLPARVDRLTEDVPKTATTAEGALQGANSRGRMGFTGPCPPPGAPHHYHFQLFALNSSLNLRPGATAEKVEAAMKGHLLASADLVGIFGR